MFASPIKVSPHNFSPIVFGLLCGGLLRRLLKRTYTLARSSVKSFVFIGIGFSHKEAYAMRIRLIRQPGQPGTKRLVAEYGAKLVCVRYRYDEVQGRRLKTVELIVEETPYAPTTVSYQPQSLIGLQVGLQEYEIQRLVKAAGGKWNPTRRVWEMRYDKAVVLELQARIVPEERSISRSQNRSK